MPPTPCDVAWSHLTIADLPPTLHVNSTPAQWAAAFTTRKELAELVLTHPRDSPFRFVETEQVHDERKKYARRVLVQSEEQREGLSRSGTPQGVAKTQSIVNTFVGGTAARRPFAILMEREDINLSLRVYVEQTCAKMIRSARRTEQANLLVYLSAKFWRDLNPLQKAEGVVASKRYRDYIEEAARQMHHHQAEVKIEPKIEPKAESLESLGHQHAPSLTSRQSRRSAVEQGELRERWA